MNRQNQFLVIAGALGASAVIAGAFGAHGLKDRLSAEMTAVYHTAVEYHIYHALAMLALGVASERIWTSRWAATACTAWIAGVTIFSGSLYLLALTEIRWLGAITPIGGVALILGWVFLIPAAVSLRDRS